jgi:HlyD family secretion protein
MASRKARIGIAVVAVAVLGGIVAWNVTKDSRDRVVVQTTKVERKDLVSVVTASGEIRPKRYVNVGANVSGRIEQLLVVEGQTVRKGQVLARIESTRFEAGAQQSQAGLEASRADLRRAEADLEVSRLNFERTKSMHADKLVSDQQFDQAKAEIQMKQAAVDAQRRRINQQQAIAASSQDELDKTTVLSPMDGVVTSLQKEQGESVIGAQSFSPTTILTVGDLSTMEVEVLVDETDIDAIELQQTAEIRVDALEGRKLKGQVTEIGSSALPRGGSGGNPTAAATNTGNQAKDFKIVVTLVDPPKTLRPGLNATAEIQTAEKKSALSIPIQAVVVREVDAQGKVIDPGAVQAADKEPEGEAASSTPRGKGQEKEGVFVVKDGKALFTPIQTGIMGDTDIEVTGGLTEGSEIVSGTYRTLRTLKHDTRIKLDKKDKKDRS